MALTRFSTDGYGQLELNQVAFRRDGRIEAQCALRKADSENNVVGFSKDHPAENGMILAIDKVNNEVKLPTSTDKVFALNYTTEYMYDERANALKDFNLIPGTFLPRLGYLAIGDRFTTNTIVYDTTDFSGADAKAQLAAIETAVKAGTVYGCVCTDTTSDSAYAGLIKLITADDLEDVTVGPVLQAAKYYTMPNGTPGIKFLVVKA